MHGGRAVGAVGRAESDSCVRRVFGIGYVYLSVVGFTEGAVVYPNIAAESDFKVRPAVEIVIAYRRSGFKRRVLPLPDFVHFQISENDVVIAGKFKAAVRKLYACF